MLRIKAQAGQVPTAQPVPDRPVSPSPARPKRPKADPDSPHRQRLNDWIDAHDGDLIWRAETRRLVKDTLKILATSRPAEGMAMDPYEQVRLALEAAAEADRDGKVDTSIGVYAKGTIRKRIKDGEYLPLVDPALKLDAEAAKRAAEVEAKRLVKLEADAVEAKRLEAEAAKRARWESLPEAERERIKAIVAAEHPEIRPSWKVLLEAHWFAAMDRPTVEPPPPIEIPLEIPPQAPPPEPSPAPAPITLARPGRTRRLLSEPVAWVEPSPQAESDFEAKRRAVLARLGVVRTPKPIPIPPPDPDPEPDPGESESDPVPELYDWI